MNDDRKLQLFDDLLWYIDEVVNNENEFNKRIKY